MPGDININIDLESIIRYSMDRLLGLFGHDVLTKLEYEQLNRLMRLAIQRSSFVHVVGMERPLPIKEIYQPTKLLNSNDRILSLKKLLEQTNDSIILAGPGQGKTTFIHWLFINLLDRPNWIPILITLRRSDSINDLKTIIKGLSRPKKSIAKGQLVALLVDGYDEINLNQRKEVSEILEEFSSLKVGRYFLTSRLYYDIISLSGEYYNIQPFSKKNALAFLIAFSKVYGSTFVAEDLLDELIEHGFEDFTVNPLLLALVCILKSGTLKTIPKNTIGLIRRAIDTLTFRWDEAKGILRDTSLPLDGEDRIRCLMRVAYSMKQPDDHEEKVRQEIAKHLELIQVRGIDIGRLLLEIAQWYGLFIPFSEAHWGFTHRTIHDFLAARYWVESGKFTPDRVCEWNARAAYAACLTPDATNSIVNALRNDSGVFAVAECFFNNAPFYSGQVAKALEEHFEKFKETFSINLNPGKITAYTAQDLFTLVSDELLDTIFDQSLDRSVSKSRLLLRAYALAELKKRGTDLTPSAFNRLRITHAGTFIFEVKRKEGWQEFTVNDMIPKTDN